MRKIIVGLLVMLLLLSFSVARVEARATRVRGYYKTTSGRYVMPHYKTTPNRYRWDNYSSRGNYNPWTGSKGYKSWY